MRKHIEIIDFLMKKGLCSKQVLLVCSAVESLSNQQFSVVFVTILMLAQIIREILLRFNVAMIINSSSIVYFLLTYIS
jgi:hypothetical protein